ncbi:TPA: hypothetical protein NJ512_004844 [Vibrio parahaemolyticus]|nr:hypothetical protein [Vibrio parahaemolyticus]HCG8043497.1 hypothetical protein [Vibrio parahaemolyticus]
MIVKMKKVAFSCDNRRRGKNTGSLSNHILYLITDKKTKRYSLKRSDLSFSIDPSQPNLGLLLSHKGTTLNRSDLSNLVNDYCLNQHRYIIQHYVKRSRKANQLDDYQECLETKNLFNYQGSLSFTKDEYQRLLQASNNNVERVKQAIETMTRHFLANYYNQIKKEQKIKGSKTKPEEVELVTNFHIEDETNPHIHFYSHAYDPVTKRYMNPRFFSETKRIAHKQIEKQFPCLEQGVASGEAQQTGANHRKKYLSHLLKRSENWRQVRADFRALEQRIYATLESNEPLAAKINTLQQMGILLSVLSNDHVEIKQEGLSLALNIDTFVNRALKRSLRQFAKQWHFEKQHQRHSTPTIQKMETVLLNNLKAVKSALERELRQLPPSKHNQAQKDAFRVFYQRCLNTGIVINLNKQKHLSFHKLANTKQSTIRATKYNASLFSSKSLSGKALADTFSLEAADILAHQTELMSLMPKHVNYRKQVTVSLSETFNDVYQEHFSIERHRRLFDHFGIEVREEGDHTTLFNEKGCALVDIERIDENHSIISISMLNPQASAKLLNAMLLEEAKSLASDEILVISPVNKRANVGALRHLHVELIFSGDKYSEKVQVSYPGMEQDETLQAMIDKRLESELKRFEKNFQKYSKKTPDKFRFTNATGLHLLDSSRLSEAQKERVAIQIEAQKTYLKQQCQTLNQTTEVKKTHI